MLQASIKLYKNAYSGIPQPVWWLSLVMFINRSGTMVIPFTTVYLTQQGYSITEAGYVMAVFGLGSIVGSFLGGKLTDKFGAFHVQFFSLLLNGILFIVLGYMRSLFSFAACIFVLSSLGEAFRPANATAISFYSNDSNRIRCYALNRLAINLGWSIGPAAGGILAGYNYNLLFWADGLTCIAAAILFYLLLAVPKTRKQPVSKAILPPVQSAFRDVVFMKGMFYLFLVALCFFQLFTVLPLYYKNELQLYEATIGWILAMNGLLIAVLEMVLVYKLENKRHSLVYIVAGTLLVGISFPVLEIGNYAAIAFLSMIVVTFGEMFLFPFLNNFWVKRSTERNRGQYAAIYSIAFSGGIVLAPPLATQLAAWAGFTTLWFANFIICSLAALGFYFLKSKMSDDVQQNSSVTMVGP